MGELRVTIATGNAAFEPVGLELARILREVAALVEPETAPADELTGRGTIRDQNGNPVGEWRFVQV